MLKHPKTDSQTNKRKTSCMGHLKVEVLNVKYVSPN